MRPGWKDKIIILLKQAFLARLSMGNKTPTGIGSRLSITYIVNDKCGFQIIELKTQ